MVGLGHSGSGAFGHWDIPTIIHIRSIIKLKLHAPVGRKRCIDISKPVDDL